MQERINGLAKTPSPNVNNGRLDNRPATSPPRRRTVTKTKKHQIKFKQKPTSPVNPSKDDSFPPLHKYAREGKVSELERLIFSGSVNVNLKCFGCTALHWAAYEGHLECISILLRCPDIEVDAYDRDNRTPFALTARRGHLHCLEPLLLAGADINAKTQWGESAISKVASYNNLQCLESLLKLGAKVDNRDIWDETPLWKAADKGNYDCITKLLQAGANVNTSNQMGYSVLHQAVFRKHRDCVELLAQSGAKITDKILNFAKDLGDSTITEILTSTKGKQRLSKLEKMGISEWNVLDVCNWISAIGYPQFVLHFRKHDISGAVLMERGTDMETLKKDIGIESYGIRYDIKERISKLLSEKEKEKEINISRNLNFQNHNTEILRIPWEDLILYENETLGKGYFGEVKRGTWHGTEVAVKIIYRDSLKSDFGLFEKEVKILSRLRHPNVIMILGITRTKDGLSCIVTEYMSRGNLHRLVQDCPFYFDQQPGMRVKIAMDICKGMAYLHANKPDPILHRDLTSRNILIASNMVKIGDFGLAHVKHQTINGEEGGERYAVGQAFVMAPEVLRGERYTEKADVFSFGCVLYEIITGKEPHKDVQWDSSKWTEMVLQGYRAAVPDEVGDQWKDLIKDCWEEGPANRPHFKEILQRLERFQVVRDVLSLNGSTAGVVQQQSVEFADEETEDWFGEEEGVGISNVNNDDFDPWYLDS